MADHQVTTAVVTRQLHNQAAKHARCLCGREHIVDVLVLLHRQEAETHCSCWKGGYDGCMTLHGVWLLPAPPF
jgi:hypothetical protein